jgi:threonine/homoserine/homoserine lactone efflux protein
MLFWIIATVYFFIATVFFAFISRDQVYLNDDKLLMYSWIISICWFLFLVILLLYAIYVNVCYRKLNKKIRKNE